MFLFSDHYWYLGHEMGVLVSREAQIIYFCIFIFKSPYDFLFLDKTNVKNVFKTSVRGTGNRLGLILTT